MFMKILRPRTQSLCTELGQDHAHTVASSTAQPKKHFLLAPAPIHVPFFHARRVESIVCLYANSATSLAEVRCRRAKSVQEPLVEVLLLRGIADV